MEARDDAKLQSALLDMAERLLAFREAAEKLALENDKLKADLRDVRQQLMDRENYGVHEVAPGFFALRYKVAAEDDTPLHYICQPCASLGRKVVLQQFPGTLKCPACKVITYLNAPTGGRILPP